VKKICSDCSKKNIYSTSIDLVYPVIYPETSCPPIDFVSGQRSKKISIVLSKQLVNSVLLTQTNGCFCFPLTFMLLVLISCKTI